MKFTHLTVLSLFAISCSGAEAFVTSHRNGRHGLPVLKSTALQDKVSTETSSDNAGLTNDVISNLRYREAQRELERRHLETGGTLSAMRTRLREAAGLQSISSADVEEEDEDDDVNGSEVLNKAFEMTGIEFQDVSDPDFDFKNLVAETLSKAELSHWKAATRKLKKLTRRFGKLSSDHRAIPEEVYTSVLTACAEDRLHGARASEPARKVMELMVDEGYSIPSDLANSCVKNCLSDGPHGTHDGFGGIDCALAMLAAIDSSENPPSITEEVQCKLISRMAEDGSIDDALARLRELVAEKIETPPLSLFADVALACASKIRDEAEKVMTVLAYAKTAGYDLDGVASTVDGRNLLAAGVIAAEKIGNIGLGLRFLTAASNAKGCDPDTGDALVTTASPAAQRAATLIHRRAIIKASADNSWKLAVKLLELMIARGLTPSPSVWRSVVTCCAKAEKSRKATSLLLDWVELSKQGRAEKPNLRVFNTVVNACEVCGEEELTIKVLDTMKDTHDTEGNLITFNIALKRLAKQGNTRACEGIIIGMLQSGIEPSVVSYTTAIAACVSGEKNSELAVEWIKRMRSRLVQPNTITYNTALASCLDGTLEGSARASQLASEMMADIQKQVDSGIVDSDDYTNIIPNFYTRTLARQAMKQLKSNWEAGLIDRQVAKTTLRVPLLGLVEFMKTDLSSFAEQQKEFITQSTRPKEKEEEEVEEATADEELEYSAAISTHRAAAV